LATLRWHLTLENTPGVLFLYTYHARILTY
jgi:hypothetical protein